jgi:DNA-binding GntR family transcriptional regulator
MPAGMKEAWMGGRAGGSRSELREALAGRIVEHIRSERLAAGAHVAAQELADRFSVSRSPINQALRLLHEKGVLAHERNRGYLVGEIGEISGEALGLSAEGELGRVYLAIADDRSHGRLPALVSESLIRRRYGLTRAQATAVLGRIAQEGWVERRPGYGWEFSEMLTTPEALLQTYRARMALEPAALLEPGYRLEPDVAERLRATEVDLLGGALETMAPDALHERGVRFHEGIVGAGGNPFLLDALRRINRVRRLLSYRSMATRERYYQQCREHLDILGLLEERRNAEAAEALRAHLVTTIRNLDRIRPLIEPESA